MDPLLLGLSAFLCGFTLAAILVVLFRDELAELTINRHLDRAREKLAAGDSDGSGKEIQKLARFALPADVWTRVTARQVSVVYRESGMEERVRRFLSAFDDLDKGKRR